MAKSGLYSVLQAATAIADSSEPKWRVASEVEVAGHYLVRSGGHYRFFYVSLENLRNRPNMLLFGPIPAI